MGWIVILLIALIILVIWLSQRRKPSQSMPRRLPAKVSNRVQGRQGKIAELLRLGYRRRLRLTIEYETGNPMPGEPAIKFRDVDIYGFGNEYFDAYCHYRGDQRTFKICRVLSARLCDQTYQIL